MRSVIRKDLIRLWLNDEEACEPIRIPDAFPFFKIDIAWGARDENGVFAEFNSVQLWQAGDRPIPRPSVIAGHQPKPLYENDFASWTKALPPPPEDQTHIYSLRNGKFIIQNEKGWNSSPPLPQGWLDSADIEIIGRATRGCWGFSIDTKEELMEGQALRAGLCFGLTSSGHLRVGKFADPDRGLTQTPVIQRPLSSLGDLESFDTLRAIIQGTTVRLWLNDQELCDPITLPPEASPRFKLHLAGADADKLGVHAEFDSIKVWKAGDRPIPPLQAVVAKKHEPIYDNDFSDWQPDFPRPKNEAEKETYSIENGHYIIQGPPNDAPYTECTF